MTSREGAENGWHPLSAEPIAASAVEPTGEPTNGATNGAAHPAAANVSLPVDLPTLLRNLEDAYIKAALARTQFNKKEAAKLLGMGRTTLVEKLRRRSLAARSA
jgi:DNA-binding NtrC family response regulator